MPAVRGKTSEGDKAEADEEADEKEDDDKQMVVEEDFVASTYTTTGDGGGNPEYSFHLAEIDDPIVMIELEAEEEFGMQIEEENETAPENNENKTDNLEYIAEPVENEEHADLLVDQEEAGIQEDGSKEEVQQTSDNEENKDKVSPAIIHHKVHEKHATNNQTAEDIEPDNENSGEHDNEEAEQQTADTQLEGDEETILAEKPTETHKERDADTAAEGDEEEDTEENKEEITPKGSEKHSLDSRRGK